MKLLKSLAVIAILLVFAAQGAASAGEAKKKPTESDLKSSVEHQTRGNELDDQGNTKEAIKEYNEALSYNPNDTNTLFNLGTVYLKANRASDAAKIFEALLKIDGNDFEAYNLLGLAYRGCGRKDEAVKVWEKSLALNPKQTQPKKFIEEVNTQSALK